MNNMADYIKNMEGSDINLITSGIPELDSLLHGGYVRGRTYLVQGVAGTGKSLLGQHFLQAGLDNDETVVYIHGEEAQRDILTNAAQFRIDISDADFLDIGPGTDFFAEDISYDLVETAEVESERFTQDIKDVIEGVDPERVLIDPITQLQYVERDEYQYRKRFQSLIRFLRDHQVTVLTTRTVDVTAPATKASDDIDSLSDGVINLYLEGDERRIEAPKHRGVGQIDGTHGLEIRSEGMEVYPQLTPEHKDRTFDPELLSTGDEALDRLLGGGIERGSVTFITGPTGIGKSTAATQIINGLADDGGTAHTYLFDESIDQITYRAENLGVPITEHRERGAVTMMEFEPLVRSAEEFGQHVVNNVKKHDPDVVVLDGLSGYKISVQGDRQRIVRRLHALSRILKSRGTAMVITDETQELTGIPEATSTNTSYIADNIMTLCYVEVNGELDRAIGVVKKRLGDFDNRFHRFTITADTGLTIQDPFDDVQGIMSGSAHTGIHNG